MQDLAFLRHVTIGQYVPGESLIHRLDPRAKITIVLLLTIAMTVNTSYLANLIVMAICLALVGMSRIPFHFALGTIRPALPLIVLLALLQLLFYGDVSVTSSLPVVTVFEWGIIGITTSGIQLVVVSLLRFVDLMLLTSFLTNTTPMAHLSYGLEDMLWPLSRLGLPAHEISLVGAIALRFVPILAEQMETIMKAQASRGANLGMGGRFNFVRTTRSILVLIVPLFLDALGRAEDLIVAMSARCYVGGRGRTRLVQFHMQSVDYGFLVVGVVVMIALLVWSSRFPF
jgi:energy-coupling factor transport system permease protein